MTDPTADNAKLLPRVFQVEVENHSDGATVTMRGINLCDTRPQPTPPAGEPDFAMTAKRLLPGDYLTKIIGDDEIRMFQACAYKASIEHELRKAYRLGLASRPKVEDAPHRMSDAQIKHMVDQFLGWKLPPDFSPDAGISFKATYSENTPYAGKYEPSGTNLFCYPQAEAMVRHMIEGMPGLAVRPKVEDAEVIRAVENIRRWSRSNFETCNRELSEGADLLECLASENAELVDLVKENLSSIQSAEAHVKTSEVRRAEYLQRAEAAESKLAEREAELATADAVINAQLGPGQWEDHFHEIRDRALTRHAARQQQGASAEKDKP